MISNKLKFNGQWVPVMSNQFVFDFDVDNLIVDEPTLPDYVPPARVKPSCTCCGAIAHKLQPYMTGHQEYCDVHESKTPVL